jgi:hypothetical protein
MQYALLIYENPAAYEPLSREQRWLGRSPTGGGAGLIEQVFRDE